MTESRDLPWEGTYNTRDLGGLPVRAGGSTRWGSIIRSDHLDRLTDAGWSAAWNYGVRTVIDLREPGEDGPAIRSRPGINMIPTPLDGAPDTESWQDWGGGLDCTPLYYTAFLERFPQRVAQVIGHLAGAAPGAVLIHCSSGRDRTGLIALVLLSLAGVDRAAIVADYEASAPRLEPLWRDQDLGNQTAKVEALLISHGTTMADGLHRTLDGLDADKLLIDGGLTTEQVCAVRARLIAV
jgi:protein-tyrosine phosphatase